ncbi:UNVERIFIED_CONTAM: hypothetical protein Slati_0185500 [Sesamum latifolium]|uniref:Uncharacterized protein n=1 Tax=Sesamum latifolium TaxID=2727402 RepID=A0AAW2YB56_9LAMI
MEAASLIAPVQDEEIRTSVFGTLDEKAPGPDGYSAQSYKEAWPIISHELAAAVREFFEKGRMLKQINTTLLKLLPKAEVGFAGIFKKTLEVFSELSGLKANLDKSEIIFSVAAMEAKQTILHMFGYQEGHPPIKYLGLPLVASKLSKVDYQPLLSKYRAEDCQLGSN